MQYAARGTGVFHAVRVGEEVMRWCVGLPVVGLRHIMIGTPAGT